MACDSWLTASPAIVALAIFTFLLAGLVKGTIGLGLPSIVIGLLALAMTPAQAAAIMIFPSLITNVWQMFAGPYLAGLLRRMWALVLLSAVGTWLGRWHPHQREFASGRAGLGHRAGCLCRVRSERPRGSRLQRHHEWWLSPIVGLLTGW